MNWRLFSKIVGATLILISIIVFYYSIKVIQYWFKIDGLNLDWVLILYIIISVSLFSLGLLYFFFPEGEINKLLKISLSLTLFNLSLNSIFYMFAILIRVNEKDIGLLFGYVGIFLIIPFSLIALIVSIILILVSRYRIRIVE
jgi:hypothetical protein